MQCAHAQLLTRSALPAAHACKRTTAIRQQEARCKTPLSCVNALRDTWIDAFWNNAAWACHKSFADHTPTQLLGRPKHTIAFATMQACMQASLLVPLRMTGCASVQTCNRNLVSVFLFFFYGQRDTRQQKHTLQDATKFSTLRLPAWPGYQVQ